MILFPPAKVNIGLNVLGKRPDGFHEIETVMIPVPLTDILEILPAEKFEFKQSGTAIDGDQSENLCVRAFKKMQYLHDLQPVYIHLIKTIPMGAGLGGGSADAAYVLRGLNEIFKLGCTQKELQDIAAELGSDCPFFINDEIQLAKGRGEILNEIDIDLSSYWIKLINPGIHISTREAYEGVELNSSTNLERLISEPVSNWKEKIHNAFENSIFERYPEIHDLKKLLYDDGALYANLSGSGSTVFALYDKAPVRTIGFKDQWILKLNA